MAIPGRLHLLDEVAVVDARLPPEVEVGHVEYKRKLVDPHPERYNRLVSQLKWRLSESPCATAVYELGVEDGGELAGLSPAELAKSLQTLRRMGAQIDAHVSIARSMKLPNGLTVAEVLVRRIPSAHDFVETRVALVGSTGAGKSTLLGVLTSGALDNGRGKARQSLLCHTHEKRSGRTASVCRDIIGFDSTGALLNYASADVASWQHIAGRAARVISFLDLAGDERYLRTTLSGLAANHVDHACLVVNCRQGLTGAAKMHLHVVGKLGLGLFVVATHADAVTAGQYAALFEQLSDALAAPFGTCVDVASPQALEQLLPTWAAAGESRERSGAVVPVFGVSSVTGRNMNLLMSFLKAIAPARPPSPRLEPSAAEAAETDEAADDSAPVAMQVQEVYHIAGVGCVVGGTVLSGQLAQGDEVLLGPRDDGAWQQLRVFSIRRLHLPVARARAGETVAVAFETFPDGLVPRRGAYLLDPASRPTVYTSVTVAVREADARLGGVRVGTELVLYQGSLRQTAMAQHVSIDADENILRDDAKADANTGSLIVKLQLRQPAYVRVGGQVLLRQAKMAMVAGTLIEAQ